MLTNNRLIIYLSLLSLLFLSGFLSLTFGASDIGFAEFLSIMFSEKENETARVVIYQLRLPRVLLAVGIGAVLAMSGTMTQGLFRNPLADPSLIGISAGAAAGASIAMAFTAQINSFVVGLPIVSFGAFLGGLLVVLIVYVIANHRAGLSVVTMLLAGLAMNFLAGSLTSALELLGNDDFLRRMSLWRMGGLDAATYPQVGTILVILLFYLLLLPFFFRALNVLLLGESEARHLGFAVNSVKIGIVICVSLGVGVSVAVAGMIAFIGLIVPHMVRLIVGPNHSHLLPLSAIVGALFLLLADTFARTLFAPIEVPVGLMTAFLGAPLFIFLLRNRIQGL